MGCTPIFMSDRGWALTPIGTGIVLYFFLKTYEICKYYYLLCILLWHFAEILPFKISNTEILAALL